MIERLSELVNVDEALVRRGRFLTTDFLVEVGETPYHVSVERGRIASVTRGYGCRSGYSRPIAHAVRSRYRKSSPAAAALRNRRHFQRAGQ